MMVGSTLVRLKTSPSVMPITVLWKRTTACSFLLCSPAPCMNSTNGSSARLTGRSRWGCLSPTFAGKRCPTWIASTLPRATSINAFPTTSKRTFLPRREAVVFGPKCVVSPRPTVWRSGTFFVSIPSTGRYSASCKNFFAAWYRARQKPSAILAGRHRTSYEENHQPLRLDCHRTATTPPSELLSRDASATLVHRET